MDARVGDRIVIESERVGQAERGGVITEILPSATGAHHYLVRWDDGHESDIRPSAGSARIIRAEEPAKA
jgi:Domain of unknown function (DUF1918)